MTTGAGAATAMASGETLIVAMIFLRGQLQNIFSEIGNNLT